MRLNLRISPFQTVIFHFSLANKIVRDIVVEAKSHAESDGVTRFVLYLGKKSARDC